jgi:hypothetical protein
MWFVRYWKTLNGVYCEILTDSGLAVLCWILTCNYKVVHSVTYRAGNDVACEVVTEIGRAVG